MSAHNKRHYKSHRNPFRRRRHHNPRISAGGVMNFLKLGLYALIGLVATRQLPQMILGPNNTGVMAYITKG